MCLKRNAFTLCLVSFLTCFLFSKPALSLVTQGTPYLSETFTSLTGQGSKNYLAGTSSAIMAFSAIEANDSRMVQEKVNDAINSWETSKMFYTRARDINRVFNTVNTWINGRINAIFNKYHLSQEYGIGKNIKDKIDEMGAKGLIEMTIISIENLQKRIDAILKKYESLDKPTDEELLNALIFISDELKKGIIATEFFLAQ